MSNDKEMLASIHDQTQRRQRAQREGEPSLGRYLAQIGVLGWMIVLPALVGVFAGRMLDRWMNSGIFWTGPLLIGGVAVGCWGAWRWMHGR
jgi:ATP synthase protein I